MTITAENAVDNGIKWLDANGPEGWRDKIDLERLNMADGIDCILGQLYDSYWNAPEDVRGTTMGTNSIRDKHCCEMCDGEDPGHTYASLKDEWIRRLSE